MKLEISNIAWDAHENEEVLNVIKKQNFDGIEIAPSKVFGDITHPSTKEIDKFKNIMSPYNFEFPAFQSLLFGRPNLSIFGKNNHLTLNFLKKND